ncbi:hypothetical protein GCM10020000_76980 [Streptomyces olivoverticillatus]
MGTHPHGVLPHRLPAWARKQCADPLLAMTESQPSGVRLAFRTRATAVELDVLPTKLAYVGAPANPDGVYELLVDGRPAGRATAPGGNVQTIDMAAGSAVIHPGTVGTVRFTGLSGEAKDVEIWLPYKEITELVALRTDAPVEDVPDRGRRVWLHHGSSISHGSNADGPTSIWPALAATRGGVELVNLGLGGNALLDPFVARVMRDAPRRPDQRQDRHQPGQQGPDAPARLRPPRSTASSTPSARGTPPLRCWSCPPSTAPSRRTPRGPSRWISTPRS